jgi:hypothetical protein
MQDRHVTEQEMLLNFSQPNGFPRIDSHLKSCEKCAETNRKTIRELLDSRLRTALPTLQTDR